MSLSSGFIKADSSVLPTVNQDMITGFFVNNTQFISAEVKNVKTERSAKQVYGDNAIFHVQLKREGDTCTVKGKITPEHKVRQTPYDVVVVVNKNEIVSAQCIGCAASQGGCKHVVAFLLWLHRRSEEPSVTSTQCYWKGSNLSKSVNIDVDLARLLKKPLHPLQENKTVVEHVLSMFPENQGSMFMLLQPRNNPSIHCLLVNFLESHKNNPSAEHFLSFAEAQITASMIKDVECNTRSQYQSKQWFEMRFGRITASVIYEAAKCKTFNGSLTERILGASQPFETAATLRGKLLEAKVIKAVEIKKKN